MKFPNPHAEIDGRNLEYDRDAAAALRRHPELIGIARQNLARWLRQDGVLPHPALLEWQDILFFLSPAQLADFLESDTPKANRLRQSSPCIGILRQAAALEREKDAARPA
jgi:hypothetical protein